MESRFTNLRAGRFSDSSPWTGAAFHAFPLASNPPIGEALAVHALDHFHRALAIFNSEFTAVVEAERKLIQVALKMLFATMLVDANHAALEHAEVAFCRVGMHIATSIFFGGMVHRLMRGELFAERAIQPGLIGMQA